MNIKRMMTGLMAGVLMMGFLSMTCLAAVTISDSTEEKSEVPAENVIFTEDVVVSEETEEKLP